MSLRSSFLGLVGAGLGGAATLVSGCCWSSAPAPLPMAPPPAWEAPPPPPPPPPYQAPEPAPYVEPPSLIAAPSLAQSLPQSGGTVPQRSDAPQLFSRARPVEGAVQRGLLLCHAVVRGSYDDSLFAGGADVAMSVQLGRGEPMGSPQRPSRTFSFPIASLEPGTSIAIGVVDVDVLFNDPIGNGAVTYERAPFVMEHANTTVECRIMASVEAQAQRALSRYRAALDGFATTTPALVAEDLGFASTAPVVAAAEEAASWIGWRDPDMEAALRRAREIDAAYAASIGARVVAVRETLPPASEAVVSGDRTLRVARVICDDEARAARAEMGEHVFSGHSPACHVVLAVEARRTMRLGEVPRPASLEAWTLLEDGTRERAERLATHCDDGWHSPNDALSLTAGQQCEVHLGVHDPPALLRVGGALARTPVLLRFD